MGEEFSTEIQPPGNCPLIHPYTKYRFTLSETRISSFSLANTPVSDIVRMVSRSK